MPQGATMDAQTTNEPSVQMNLGVLPPDVQQWVRKTLDPGERLNACLLADVMPDDAFGERWAFLTNRRLVVLSPNGQAGQADIVFEMPLEEVEDAEVRTFVASGALIVRDTKEGHEVVRFTLGAQEEATALCYCLKEIVRQRREGGHVAWMPVPPRRRESHRCSKCGRALRRAGEVCPHCVDKRRLTWRLLSYLEPYKTRAILGLGLTLGMTGLQVLPPYFIKVLVDNVIIGNNPQLLNLIILALSASFVLRAVTYGFRSYTMQWLGNQVLFDLRFRVFQHLQMLRLSYYNVKETGRLMSRITSDISRLQFFIAEGFQEIVVDLATMALIAIILLVLDWRLFLLALTPIPITSIGTYVFGRRIHLLYHRIWRRLGTVYAILGDAIPGIRVVKSFAQERREARRFGRKTLDLLTQQMRAVRVSSAFFPFVSLMTGLGYVLTFGVGGYMVLHQTTSLGILMAFMGYLMRFYAPVQRMGELNHRLQHAATSAERVFEILDADPEPLNTPGGIVISPLQGKVEFRNVRFSYEPGKYALDGISFVVEPGEMIGLVGPSGAGKSTLVHLIARFYDVDAGAILIDDHDIQDLALSRFREQIGVVLQEPYLFQGTIWSNIAYANPKASAEEIIAAAKTANAHDFIVNLPDGYDTVVGERGMTLSGGERQRISVARAILRDPRILILDEATASVDTETEALIQSAVERLVQNRTTFAIAHRLSTLRKADRLIVLDCGKLVELGTHEELINTGGLYSRLCRMQSELSKMRTV